MLRDNQAQDDGNKATTNPAATDPPSRKRLLTDPKPNQGSATASPESTLSSDSSSDRLKKKTRELPNLSDCHSCGLRINYSNPRERLQPLDSVWRVVLLCQKCIKRIKSAELCSYCFSGTLETVCFKCRDCQRCIHSDCVVKYGGYAPWSYSCSGLGFSVCVDCWVPESLVNSIRVYRKRSRRKNKIAVLESSPLPDSRVSGTKLLENAVKDANCVVEKKIAVATKAKENALRKAVVAKNAVELANGALNLVAKKDEKATSTSSRDNTETRVVDDAKLAFMLHRAMNSSSRISKNKCSMNSNSLAAREMCHSRGSRSSSACLKFEVCDKSMLSDKINKTVSEPSVSFKTSDCGSCIDLDTGAMTNTNTSPIDNDCQENDDGICNEKPDRYLLKYRRIGKNVSKPSVSFKASDCGSCVDSGNWNTGAMTDTKTCLNGNECQENGEGLCTNKPDRYLLKYRKRSISSKPVLSSETKFLYDSLHLENQVSAPSLLLNCSEESRTFSDAPFQSCTQAFACASGSSREQP